MIIKGNFLGWQEKQERKEAGCINKPFFQRALWAKNTFQVNINHYDIQSLFNMFDTDTILYIF